MKNIHTLFLLFVLCCVPSACNWSTGDNPPDIGAPDNTGAGSTLPFITYEAEAGPYQGELLRPSTEYYDIQSEASGRSAVKLRNPGDYAGFILEKPANSIVVRYCMPDSAGGGGTTGSLALYAGDTKLQDIALTSEYAWVYGEYPWTNSPQAGKGHRFFDETRVLFATGTVAEGTIIRLQKENDGSIEYCIIDSADFELAGDPLPRPPNFLSITDYGAAATDGGNDYQALVNCIRAAKSQGKGVWIPEGVFEVLNGPVPVSNVTIRGAGMWHSTLSGVGAAFMMGGNNCAFYDFSLLGNTTVRIDSALETGFDGSPGSGSRIENIWMEHLKVGVWAKRANGLVIENCRIRNTFADGVNLNEGTQNSVVRNCHFRNTGDDSIAINSENGSSNSCQYNTIINNTVQSPWLASGIAVYGGGDNTIEKNSIHDTIAFGGGINISSNFGSAAFSGTTTVKNNVLVRTGSREWNMNYNRGAIWIWAAQSNINAAVEIYDNEIYNSAYDAVTIEGPCQISGLSIRNIKIEGAGTYGIFVRSGAKGSASLSYVAVSKAASNGLRNDSSGKFTITRGSGNTGW